MSLVAELREGSTEGDAAQGSQSSEGCEGCQGGQASLEKSGVVGLARAWRRSCGLTLLRRVNKYKQNMSLMI